MIKPQPIAINQEAGFSLLETIIAIIVATTFTLITLQTIVIGALFKSKALKRSEAINVVQQDLEVIRSQTARYKRSSLASAAVSGATSVTVASSSSNFEANDEIRIGSAGTYTISSVSGTTLNLGSGLSQNVNADDTVAAIGSCDAADVNSGFADQFRDFRHGSNESNDSTLTYQETGTKSDRTYTIEVTFTPKNQEPFDVLIVEHRVYDLSASEFSSASDDTKEEALLTENYSEVIPYAAFEC